MSNRIKIIIAIIVIILVAGVIIFWFLRSSQSASQITTSGNAGSETSVPISGAPASLQVPTSSIIQMEGAGGTVMVNNFYKNVIAYEDEFLILAQTSDYEITYDTVQNQFYIEVFGTSDASRSAGEQNLLSILGVSQSDACRLNVGESGDESGFSFCGGGAFQTP
jgi:hypothetical protein